MDEEILHQKQTFSRAVGPETGKESRRIRDRMTAFRNKYFPRATDGEWNDWHWQRENSLTDLEALEKVLRLSKDEREALSGNADGLPVLVTPYYAGLLDPVDSLHPLRRTVVPVMAEYHRKPGEQSDPLSEKVHSPVPGIVHRYTDRVLFLVSDYCASYCRYCTRSRRVGRRHSDAKTLDDRWNAGIAYIESNQQIRDILVSGGDPLILDDDRLDDLLARLRGIPHVDIIRIGTKAPLVLPQRVTPSLVKILRKHQPLWMSLHCTHPDELTTEAGLALSMLADEGIPLQSQTVLLAGVNDRVGTLQELFQGLLRLRVRPYYLFQCDPVAGSEHFRVPVKEGLKITAELRKSTSGMAVPLYMIDPPGGGGKIPLMAECLTERDGALVLMSASEGESGPYEDDSGLSFALERGDGDGKG